LWSPTSGLVPFDRQIGQEEQVPRLGDYSANAAKSSAYAARKTYPMSSGIGLCSLIALMKLIHEARYSMNQVPPRLNVTEHVTGALKNPMPWPVGLPFVSECQQARHICSARDQRVKHSFDCLGVGDPTVALATKLRGYFDDWVRKRSKRLDFAGTPAQIFFGSFRLFIEVQGTIVNVNDAPGPPVRGDSTPEI
jgi:hypothetical protein